MQALLDMANPIISLTSLRLFYNTILTHTQALVSLEKSKKVYGDLLISVILKKLSIEVRKNLAREQASVNGHLMIWPKLRLKETQVFETGCQVTDSQSSSRSIATLGLRTIQMFKHLREILPVFFVRIHILYTHVPQTLSTQQQMIQWRERIYVWIVWVITRCLTVRLNSASRNVRKDITLVCVMVNHPSHRGANHSSISTNVSSVPFTTTAGSLLQQQETFTPTLIPPVYLKQQLPLSLLNSLASKQIYHLIKQHNAHSFQMKQ